MALKLIEVVKKKKPRKGALKKNEHGIQTFLVHKVVCVCVSECTSVCVLL